MKNTCISFETYGDGPCMAHVTWVASPSGVSVSRRRGVHSLSDAPEVGQHPRCSKLILMSVQDDTNYGMLSVVTDGWRNAWQDLDR